MKTCFIYKSVSLDSMSEKPSVQPSFAKKILKKDSDVGKVNKGVPVLISHITDLFIQEMITSLTSDETGEIKVANIIELIKNNKKYDFLQEEIPKFEQISASEKTIKRKKANDEDQN